MFGCVLVGKSIFNVLLELFRYPQPFAAIFSYFLYFFFCESSIPIMRLTTLPILPIDLCFFLLFIYRLAAKDSEREIKNNKKWSNASFLGCDPLCFLVQEGFRRLILSCKRTCFGKINMRIRIPFSHLFSMMQKWYE